MLWHHTQQISMFDFHMNRLLNTEDILILKTYLYGIEKPVMMNIKMTYSSVSNDSTVEIQKF